MAIPSIRPMFPPMTAPTSGYDSSGINPGGIFGGGGIPYNPLHSGAPPAAPGAGGDPAAGVPAPTGPVPGSMFGGAGGGFAGGDFMNRIAPMMDRMPADSPWRGIMEQIQAAMKSGDFGQGQIRDIIQQARQSGTIGGGFGGMQRATPAVPATPGVAPATPATPAAPAVPTLMPSTENNAFNKPQGLGGHQAIGGFGGSALAGGMPKAFGAPVAAKPPKAFGA